MNPINFIKAVGLITKLQGLVPLIPQALVDYEAIVSASKDPIAESEAISKFMDDFKAAFTSVGLTVPPTK